MTHKDRAALAIGAALVLAMGSFLVLRLEVSTRLTHFLSQGSEAELASLSSQIADSELTRTLTLLVSADELEGALEASARWGAVIEAHPEVASIQTGPGPGIAEEVYALYFPRRHFFVSSEPERDLAPRLAGDGLDVAARDLRASLMRPDSALVQQTAPADPFQAFPALLERLQEARTGSIRVVDGRYVAGEPPSALLFVRTRHSAFDASHQGPFVGFLADSFEDLGPGLRLRWSGVHRFAATAESGARADMERISAISIVGIVLVFLLVFRSLRILALAVVPLVAGILLAMTVGQLAFGSLHLITLVFGCTLIGVCIDYPIHYLNHQTALPEIQGGESLRPVWRALWMGAATTVAGFAGIAWSNFPGVREIGVFAAVGVAGALAATRWLLPPLAPQARATPLQVALSARLANLLEALDRHRGPLLVFPIAALVLCGVALPRLAWQDDVSALNAPLDAAWLAEDAEVRAAVASFDASRFVVALGRDDEDALQRNEAVYERLAEQVRDGSLAGFRSLHSFLWSAELQLRNWAVLRSVDGLPGALRAAFEREGFRPEAFDAFASGWKADPPAPLRYADLSGSSLGLAVAPFRVDLGDQIAILTFLRGVADPDSLSRSLASLDSVHYFDQQRFVAKLYGGYRDRALKLLIAGVVAVFALLVLRYRQVPLALAAIGPALLAGATTLSAISLFGLPINLLHLLGALLVLCMGVDYGIFLLEGRTSRERSGVTLLSISIACASSCLAFGLLAASSFPALRALGLTTGIGVILSLLFAPTALVLSRRGK